jgi:glycosyltransferase involved in cell wall biosynthesis
VSAPAAADVRPARRARPPISFVAAVVPAHDEARRLGRCLDALARAVATARATGLAAHVVVVLDGCTDASAAVCAGRPGVVVVRGAWRRVGAARAAGCAAALEGAAGEWIPAAATWLASTDADSVVPFDWLTHHVRLADRGADAVRGAVGVDDWSGWAPSVRTAYLTAYRHDPHHPHIHGANLGVRGSAYLDA